MKTLVLGASINPNRYSFLAINDLRDKGHEVVAVGNREGVVRDVTITKEFPLENNIDTVTLYLGAKNQINYYKPLLALKPRRVIFNPGTANPPFEKALEEEGIEVIDACTLVMLRTDQY